MPRSLLFVILVALAACSRDVPSPPPAAAQPSPLTLVRGEHRAGGARVNLPKAIGPWVRADAPKRVTAETIFDYMDGGGELYLGYRFDHLDVYEYRGSDASLGTVLVELYFMKDSADAFGLLSTDWSGEVPEFGKGPGPSGSAVRPPDRALYGAGLLRMWNRRLYVRILADRETPASREAVLTIGREISSEEEEQVRDAPSADPKGWPAPVLLEALRGTPGDGSVLRPDRTCFFRSHLVLNAAYFLASDDILGLGPDVEAVTGEYRPPTPGGRPTRVILVRYPSAARAGAALETFAKTYLPAGAAKSAGAGAGAVSVEHGWVAWRLEARDLAIALDASSETAARHLASSTIKAVPPPGSAYR